MSTRVYAADWGLGLNYQQISLVSDDLIESVDDFYEFLRSQAADSLAYAFSGQGPDLAHFDPGALGEPPGPDLQS